MEKKKGVSKSKIKKAASKMFFEMNYEDVSMRDIASNADMTVGNIYRYYTNKEILFDDIVGNCYEKMLKLIKVREQIPEFLKSNPRVKDNKGIYKNQKFRKIIMEYALNLLVKNSSEVYILLCNSKGSKYEDLQEQIKSVITDTIVIATECGEDMAEIYAYMIVSTATYILKKYVGNKEKLESALKIFLKKLIESF